MSDSDLIFWTGFALAVMLISLIAGLPPCPLG